jgi:hypothetical protein
MGTSTSGPSRFFAQSFCLNLWYAWIVSIIIDRFAFIRPYLWLDSTLNFRMFIFSSS